MPDDTTGHDFDRLAPYYDRGLSMLLLAWGGEGRLRRRIASSINCENLRRGSRILEVGCGTASNMKTLDDACPSCYELVGLDYSKAMLRVARGKKFSSRESFVRGDAAVLPFRDKSFAAAIAIFTLHEMPESGRTAAAAELCRVLEVGGCLLLVDLARPRGAAGRALFPLLGLIESRESLEFARRGPQCLFAGLPFIKETSETLYLGLLELLVLRKTV